MGAEGIPNEVLLKVMEYISKAPKESNVNKSWSFEALRNSRLVCRRLNQAAMLALFRILHLRYLRPPPGTGSLSTPTTTPIELRSRNASFQRWQRAMSLYIARLMVKLVIIDSPHRPSPRDEAAWLWYCWEKWLESEFTTAVDHISGLPNLNAVEVHFGSRAMCEPRPRFVPPRWRLRETSRLRLNALSIVLASLNARGWRMRGGGSPISSLALKNIHSLNKASTDDSDWAVYQYMYFQYLHFCRNIKHLHLHVVSGRHRHPPSLDEEIMKLCTFEPILRPSLLFPIASHLRVLTLSFQKEWGTVPSYFSGCGLLFPVLKTLHLRFFTISHDDHLDWVLRMPDLKRLYLAETKIMTLASCNLAVVTRWKIPTHDWKPLPHGAYGFSGQQDSVYEYPRRWGYFFNRIKSELGRLSDFRIFWSSPHQLVWYDGDNAPWTEVPKSAVSMDSFVERYAALRFGIGKDHARWFHQRNGGILDFGNGNPDPDRTEPNTGSSSGKKAQRFNPAAEHMEED